MNDMGYEDLPGFENVYLEDSFVIDVRATPGEVVFTVEVVLLETHPLYSEPADGDQYCYRRGEVVYREVTALRWERQGLPPAIDLNNEIDYGSFDEFGSRDGQWIANGNWGDLFIESSLSPVVSFR
jgi:hypothetical protein